MQFVGLERLKTMTIPELRSTFSSENKLSRNKLEMNSFNQTKIFEKWYTLCEETAGDVKDWEARLIRLSSKLDLKFRGMSKDVLQSEFGLKDLKEGAIKSLIALDTEFQKVSKKIRDLKRRHSVCKGFVESCRQRKSMIRELERLYVAKYWDKAE